MEARIFHPHRKTSRANPAPSNAMSYSPKWLAISIGWLVVCCDPGEQPSTHGDAPPRTVGKVDPTLDHTDSTRPDSPELLEPTTLPTPAIHLEHPGFEIRHLAIRGESLWAVVAHPPFHTAIRWNLAALEIESVLFPTRDVVRTFSLSPNAGHAVVTRGEVSLLIDAASLKPIADLGSIPDGLAEESAITFSRDSLLFAHPSDSGWHIRDTATGEIIRSIDMQEIDFPIVIASHLDPEKLRILTPDGTRIDIPVSPIEAATRVPFEEAALDILHACITNDGETAIAVCRHVTDDPPGLIELELVEKPKPADFDIDSWARRLNQSALTGINTGILAHLDPPAVGFSPGGVLFHGGNHPPLITDSLPVAYTADPSTDTFATAEACGRITIHRPTQINGIPGSIPQAPSHGSLTILHHRLIDALPAGALTPHDLPPSPTNHSPSHNLAAAMMANDATAIAAILESATDIPATLRTLAISLVHLHQGNTAAAFAPYHQGFPNIPSIRLREDWRGWERPDFQPAVDRLEEAYHTLIASFTIDPAATESEREKTITRLLSSEAYEALGRHRYAIACLDAATMLIPIAGEAEHAFALAALARRHGAPPVPCLRLEAITLAALDRFEEARDRWVDLLTEHPAEEHLTDDYTEAAYTSFENTDARQALEILITGMHRFGDDASFALRSGWIALLAGHPGHARDFLHRGSAAGFPDEELENATALLVSATAQTGDIDAASVHFEELIALDPAWGEAATLDNLPWPDHIKNPLRELITQRSLPDVGGG